MIQTHIEKHGIDLSQPNQSSHYVSTALWQKTKLGSVVSIEKHPEVPGVLLVYRNKKFICCAYEVQGLEYVVGRAISAKRGLTAQEAAEVGVQIRLARDRYMDFLGALKDSDLSVHDLETNSLAHFV